MTRWEYKVLSFPSTDSSTLMKFLEQENVPYHLNEAGYLDSEERLRCKEALLNQLGARGWELVTAHGHEWYLKRAADSLPTNPI